MLIKKKRRKIKVGRKDRSRITIIVWVAKAHLREKGDLNKDMGQTTGPQERSLRRRWRGLLRDGLYSEICRR